MAEILTVTVNPAIDIAADIDHLEADLKLRCANPHTDPGGGGVNVSRALKELGGESDAFVAVGGPTGDLLLWLLAREMTGTVRFSIDGLTRQSFTINEATTARQYRFILPGPAWREDEWRRALADIVRLSVGKTHVVLSGSLAPGMPDDFYLQLARALSASSVHVILDTSGPALAAALNQDQSAFFCIRMNRTEAKAFAGGDLLSAEQAKICAQDLVKRKVAAIVILTLGGKGAVLASEDEVLFVAAPHVEKVSAVGAGDCFVAAFTYGVSKGWRLRKACSYGVAAAAAAMTTPATQLCRRLDTDRCFEQILKTQGEST